MALHSANAPTWHLDHASLCLASLETGKQSLGLPVSMCTDTPWKDKEGGQELQQRLCDAHIIPRETLHSLPHGGPVFPSLN